MKKFYLAIIAFLLVITTILLNVPIKKANNKNTEENSKVKKYPYYKKEYKKRYKTYQLLNPNLKFEKVIIKVNIGLDQKPYTNTKPADKLNKTNILVNKYRSLNPEYTPNNLVDLDPSYSRNGMKLVKCAKDMLEIMVHEARKEGYDIRVMSSYRSYQYQEKLYNDYVAVDGKEEADAYSARPGFSEHQTGLAVDIDNNLLPYTSFEQTKTYTWMINNCYKYGFILRYPKDKEEITGYNYESWHYRYVGKDIAKYIHTHNITFDEYYIKFIDKN